MSDEPYVSPRTTSWNLAYLVEEHVGAEHLRLQEDARREQNWKRWGPYLSERQWGTVREDYSPHGDAWDYFPHDHARSRAYRWGEDGLLGICDRECRLCFALALWNGRDPILKERLFGLTGPEGNHGEDVKECYYYLDATPTHSYLKALYKYPQARVPVRAARRREPPARHGASRSSSSPTPASSTTTATSTSSPSTPRPRPTTSCIRITVANRGPGARRRCTCCRRSGSATPGRWGAARGGATGRKPRIDARRRTDASSPSTRRSAAFGSTRDGADGARPSCCSPRTRPTPSGCSASPNAPPYVKDAFHELRRRRPTRRGEPGRAGTKAAAALRARRAGRRAAVAARCGCRADDERRRRTPFGADVRRDLRASASPRPTRSTRRGSPRALAPEERARRAPGVRGAALVEAVLPLRRRATGSRAIPRSRRRPRARQGRNARLAAPLQPRRASRCRTSGSTRGSRRGTSPST